MIRESVFKWLVAVQGLNHNEVSYYHLDLAIIYRITVN